MAESNTAKTYYNITEVSKIIGVSSTTLRYWESEFAHLKPKTGNGNVRQYTEKNIEDLKVIYNLVKVRGFKISAARKALHAGRVEVEHTDKIIQKLQSVKSELQLLKEQLDVIV